MNTVALLGRLTQDPNIRNASTTVATYTLAVDRRFKKDGEPTADFIRCVSFGKAAEFAEKYFHKGIKIAITGRIQTGSYEDKDGKTIHTTDIIVESQEFAESKNASKEQEQARPEPTEKQEEFYIPTDDSKLPFA